MRKTATLLVIILILVAGIQIVNTSKSEDDKKDLISVKPFLYQATYHKVYDWYVISDNAIFADAPEKDIENPNDYERTEGRYHTHYIPARVPIDIALRIWNPTDTTVKDLNAKIKLPNGWVCTGIEFDIYRDAVSGDSEMPPSTEGLNNVIFHIETDYPPMYLGFDSDGDGFADIFHSSRYKNFERVDCEAKKYPIIWSTGADVGNYKVVCYVSGSNAKEVEQTFEINLE